MQHRTNNAQHYGGCLEKLSWAGAQVRQSKRSGKLGDIGKATSAPRCTWPRGDGDRERHKGPQGLEGFNLNTMRGTQSGVAWRRSAIAVERLESRTTRRMESNSAQLMITERAAMWKQ